MLFVHCTASAYALPSDRYYLRGALLMFVLQAQRAAEAVRLEAAAAITQETAALQQQMAQAQADAQEQQANMQ